MDLNEFLQMERDQSPKQGPPSPEQLEMVQRLIDQRMGPYRIGPSDVLLVSITGRDVELPLSQLQVRVDESGEVDLPIIGGIKVAQMTLKEADDAIQTPAF